MLATVALVALWRPRQLGQVLARYLEPRLDSSSPTGTLSRGEMENLVAFGEVLVEGRPLSADERRHLIEHVDERTQSAPGYLALYRMTASLLDRLAGTRFAALDLSERTDVMTRHRLTPSEVGTTEYLLPFRRQELRVRALAVPDLIRGYYRSPAGWAVVGYEAFPGRCSNLIRYTLPERRA
jgi:hypothetical protein